MKLSTYCRVVAALVASLSLSSCAVTYQFDPIEAWVIDAETGKPIVGAVVTANWQLVRSFSLHGTRYFGQLEVKETVTDANGRFYFEGFSKRDTSGEELREDDPQILVFKNGYYYQRFSNSYPDFGIGLKKARRTAAVSGKKLKLEKLDGDKARMSQRHMELVSWLDFVREIMPQGDETGKCYWQRIPRMILETREQEILLRTAGVKHVSSIYDSLIHDSDELVARAKVPCVSPKKLLLN